MLTHQGKGQGTRVAGGHTEDQVKRAVDLKKLSVYIKVDQGGWRFF